MNNLADIKPVKLLREDIPKVEIAKYYLEVEFSKLFKSVDIKRINETIDNLKETKVWALLEAVSFTYHLNGVFFKLAREGYVWHEEIWNVSDVLLTGMDTNVNKVIFSQEVKGDAIKFKNYLLNYFQVHKENDPENLFSYRPTKSEIKYTKLLATRRDNKIAMLDGSHRLTEMLLNDIKEVHIYVGHPIEGIPEENKKTLIGNSALILLTILYKQGNEEEKKAVLTVVKEIIAKTINGREATQKYWVDNIYNDEFKEVGLKLLSESI